MIISMIAAMAHHQVIGKDNKMPWHLPADFSWFKRCTLGKPIVMGRKTFESIGRPLPGRTNIVVSRDANLSIDGVIIVTNFNDAILAAHGAEEVMIIGGGSIYQAYLERCQRLYLTYIDADIDGDTQFPDFGKGWEQSHRESYLADDNNAYDMKFVVLDRVLSE
jgi:dihydrofolate reductase